MNDASLLWCGSIRCYFLVRPKGPNTAFVQSSGTDDAPKRHVWQRRYDRQPKNEEELASLFAAALTELLEQPKGFPLHGMHWVSRAAGGQGAVITDGTPRGVSPQLAALGVRADMLFLRDSHGWEL